MRENKSKQKGMALIEVMLAALVLSVGSVGFLKLQNIGLQGSFNDYARAQGVGIAQGFSDGLRGNIRFLQLADADKSNSLISQSTYAGTVALPQANHNCNPALTPPPPGGSVVTASCAKSALDYHLYLTNARIQAVLPGNGRSVLCYREHPTRNGYMRMTFMWLDSTSGFSGATLQMTNAECPANFNDPVGSNYLNNSVTVYAQI